MTTTDTATQPLLDVRHVRKYFPVNQGVLFRRPVGWIKAVDDVAFAIGPGQTFGLVGESGCGKSTLAKLILLLEPLTDGEIMFEGQSVARLSGEGLKRYRAAVGAVFQDPFSSLSPRMRVREIVGDPLTVTTDTPRPQIEERVSEVLEQVGLNPASASNYPHEFSGGQRQRIAIARALSASPRLVILDEPVSALDASIRAQIINLLKALQRDLGLSYLLIAHDLGTVRFLSDQVGVMYLGQLVEKSSSPGGFHQPAAPLHPGPAVGGPAGAAGRATGTNRDFRRSAQPPGPAGRLPLLPSLPGGHAGLREDAANPGRGRTGPRGSLPPLPHQRAGGNRRGSCGVRRNKLRQLIQCRLMSA